MGLKHGLFFSSLVFMFLVSIVFIPSINNPSTSSPSMDDAVHSSSVLTPKTEGGSYTPDQLLAIEMAKNVFDQNHTQSVYNCTVFRYYENTSVFFVAIYYLVTFNCPEGQYDVTYRRDYIVDIETREVRDGPFNTDVPDGFVISFTGKKPVATKQQATDTYFLLLQKSPSANVYIYSVDNDRLSLEVCEIDDRYNVIGVFKNFAVNCLDAKIVIEYDIFHNGTAMFQRATTVVDCGSA
jgi:hypothetical protein